MTLCAALLSLLTTNLILTGALGTSTLMAAVKNRSSLVILALLMTGFSTASCFLANRICALLGMELLSVYPWSLALPLVYTAAVSVIYIIALLVLSVLLRDRFQQIRAYVHLSAFNCAVMGALYTAFEPVQPLRNVRLPSDVYILGVIHADKLTAGGAALYGLQAGLGFLLGCLMLSAVRSRLYDEEVPAAFRGFPAVLVYMGLLSMAVYAITV